MLGSKEEKQQSTVVVYGRILVGAGGVFVGRAGTDTSCASGLRPKRRTSVGGTGGSRVLWGITRLIEPWCDVVGEEVDDDDGARVILGEPARGGGRKDVKDGLGRESAMEEKEARGDIAEGARGACWAFMDAETMRSKALAVGRGEVLSGVGNGYSNRGEGSKGVPSRPVRAGWSARSASGGRRGGGARVTTCFRR